MTDEAKNYLQLHFVVLIWGFTAILGVLISSEPLEIVFYRTLLASIILYFVLRFKRLNFKIGYKEFIKILSTGFIIGLHWVLFFSAARYSNVSVCLAGMATCSFWTSILEPLMTRRKFKIYELILGILVVLGLYLIFRFELREWRGLIMAILAAILASLFTIINGKFTHRHSQYTITFYEMLGACLISLLAIPLFITIFNIELLINWPSLSDGVYLLILASICTVFTFSLSVKIQKILSAFVVNLTVNLEPIYGILLAILIFGQEELMSSGFYWGMGIILLSVLSYPLINKLTKRKPLESDVIR